MQAHSQRVLPLIQSVLVERGWTFDDLTGLAFGAGPGSFTGVRIACGVAQGLALGRDLPIVPVATLEALAEQAHRRHRAERVVGCLDARMQEVYVGWYERDGTAWRVIRDPEVSKPAEVVPISGDWFGCGEGFAAHAGLAARLGIGAVDASALPFAQDILSLALPRFANGQSVDAANALPLYVRHRVALTSAQRAAGERL